MTTEILNSQNEEDFEKAVSILKNGGILAFPTETVFGIGADMNNESAVKRIYEIKERNFSKPLSIHVANLEIAKPYIKNVPDDAYILEKNYLPGPLMMIFDKTDLVPNYVTANLHKSEFLLMTYFKRLQIDLMELLLQQVQINQEHFLLVL